MGTIQRVLLAISHSGNLAIYCISSRKFRSVLGKKMFGFIRKNREQNFQMENLQISQYITRDISSAKMNDEKLYLCSICRKPFKSIKGVRGLKTHIRIDHFQHRPHQCPHCEMSFDLEAHLSRHLESRHPSLWKGGEKNYLCDKCDSQFFTRNLLYSE